MEEWHQSGSCKTIIEVVNFDRDAMESGSQKAGRIILKMIRTFRVRADSPLKKRLEVD